MKKYILLLFMVSSSLFAAQFLEIPISDISTYTTRFDRLVTISTSTWRYTFPIYGSATHTTVMLPLDERALKVLTATEAAALIDVLPEAFNRPGVNP